MGIYVHVCACTCVCMCAWAILKYGTDRTGPDQTNGGMVKGVVWESKLELKHGYIIIVAFTLPQYFL